MEQKRFLTADEVFQLFGVDGEALEQLVDSGAVKALADFGSFKYRSEDFATLVQDGTLIPRTSGELFQADSDGELPFLKLKSEDESRIEDEVSFLELDEDALNEQANPIQESPSALSENWFDDSEEAIAELVSSDDSGELTFTPSDADAPRAHTELDFQSDPAIGELPDSDSDVRIIRMDANLEQNEDSESSNNMIDEGQVSPSESAHRKLTESDSDVVLVFPTDDNKSQSPLEGAKPSKTTDSDSDVRLSMLDSQGEIKTVGSDTNAEFEGVTDSPVTENDDGIMIAASPSDSGITLVGPDSGISLESADSGISLESADSGIRLAFDDDGDAVIGNDSGISLDSGDSGISLESADSGDSGIRLEGDDSGISFGGGDSGITLEDDVFDPSSKNPEEAGSNLDIELVDDNDEVIEVRGNSATQSLDLSDELMVDSGFDVNLAEEDHTAELNFKGSDDETPGYQATVVLPSGKKPPGQTPALSLSAAFDANKTLEVDELDISEELDGASSSNEFSDEFAAVEDDEVFEASDADFSEAELSSADEDILSDNEVLVPAAKVRKGPKEPEWGMLAIAPIACASLLMLATVTVLWGGISTMWTGVEAPGPASTLISTLAGLSPF